MSIVYILYTKVRACPHHITIWENLAIHWERLMAVTSVFSFNLQP